MAQRLRLVLDGPLSAQENMARDRELLESVGLGRAPQTLRVYSWNAPAYTIGYFQSPETFAARGVAVIKRPTGGGAVLHGRDLTFALALKLPNDWLGRDVKGSYLKINWLILQGLRTIYPAMDFAQCKDVPGPKAQRQNVCFESPTCYDLMLDGKKVVGSSQRRTRAALLHQSSIFLEGDRDRIVQALRGGFEREFSFF